ncbi:RagB/SusD family nutrient uptake outer membrane protein [Dinghuibacter silviterrae]|uniref:Putative outer membrane starch-binding protein n=1 Tax=Dinghuibacter silviterrae TaxID=1539049 RepID=A0A4R8DRX4_9BACT|nr:RagB/SusD family nutrient uptake outer membrane protein [Dinghuibacter silviterrae]TDX00984.1 putative outer membrane starch-binding protein [Dinghuibacter silviterrae]
MNKKFLSIPALAVALLLGSCAKKLDIVPQGSPTLTGFWKTQADAEAADNAMYASFGNSNGNADEFYGRGYFWFINASDDMVTGRNNSQANNVKNFNPVFNGWGNTEVQWDQRYAVIKKANDIINNLPGIDMDTAEKRRIIGEAYFMSGLMYFQLVSNYGNDKAGVPIADRANPSDPNPIPRAANAMANYTYLVSDLKQAAVLLPFFSTYIPDMYGHAHKTAAWAFLAKAYLYMKDYADAELYADSVISSGQHALLANFADVFKIANNWSSEYIWSAVSTAQNGGWGSILPGCMLENKGWGIYNGWGYYTPTQELYNAYSAQDTRLAATILKPGDKFVFWGDTMIYHSVNSESGYQFNKYMEPFSYAGGIHVSSNGNEPTTDLNVPLLRYAEVLLIDAEAKLMQGKSGDVSINLIRQRAGLAPITGATMTELKLERRLELAGEWADRHRDLVRWGDAQATYALPLHGADGTVCWPARTFDPTVDDVWPVPQTDIDNSHGVITQNPGW